MESPLLRSFAVVTSQMKKFDQRMIARELSNNATPAERILWRQIRSKNLGGLRMLRQKVIRYKDPSGKEGFFIVDFLCPKRKLVIELDGAIHKNQFGYDRSREEILKAKGLTVLRFNNEEILNDLASVMAEIRAYIS
jgi:leucyl-tRNA synthetase